MSFHETDYPALLDYLKELIAANKNPLEFKQLVINMLEIYDQIPVYPGIAAGCSKQLEKPIKAESLAPGQTVFVKVGDDEVSGEIKSISDDAIVLKKAELLSVEENFEIEKKEMSNLRFVDKGVLKEMWPSLVFDKDKK